MRNRILPRLKLEKKILSISVLLLVACFFSVAAHAENPAPQKTWSQDKRYADNGDETITDTKTELMWMKMDAFQQKGHLLNWKEAIAFVEKLNTENFADHNDWRAPTRKELVTLYEADKINSSLDMNVHIDPLFAKNGLAAQWSSELNGQFNAFGVVFNTGDIFSANIKAKSKKSVRAVRNIK